jgi:hypothetical protein
VPGREHDPRFRAASAAFCPQETHLHAINAVIARGGISGRLIRGSRPPCANPRRPRACRNRVLKRNSHACAALASADLPARAAGTRQHSQSRRRRSATTAAGEPRFPRVFSGLIACGVNHLPASFAASLARPARSAALLAKSSTVPPNWAWSLPDAWSSLPSTWVRVSPVRPPIASSTRPRASWPSRWCSESP